MDRTSPAERAQYRGNQRRSLLAPRSNPSATLLGNGNRRALNLVPQRIAPAEQRRLRQGVHSRSKVNGRLPHRQLLKPLVRHICLALAHC